MIDEGKRVGDSVDPGAGEQARPSGGGVAQLGYAPIVLFGLGVALETAARVADYVDAYPLLGASLSLLAGACLSSTVLYVVWRFGRGRRPSRLVVLAVALFLVSRSLELTDRVALLDSVPIVGAESELRQPFVDALFVSGLLLLVTGFLATVVEAHGVHAALRERHEALLRETEGRRRAQEAVRTNEQVAASLERQLRQAQKLEAIGTLAGGIAHDFNNTLALILGHSEMAQASLPKGHAAQRNLEHIVQASNRAANLVSQILTFSRQVEIARRALRLEPVLKEAMALIRASLPTTIRMEMRVADGCGAVSADPTQVHQVIINLCTNAFHAMPDGGSLLVSLDPVEVEQETLVGGGTLLPGKYVRLTVRDTGHGMDAETVQRVFDPFFTTKQHAGGTGLGLSTVHGIVTATGGGINVTSAPGKGAVFDVYFPRAEAEADGVAAIGGVQGGDERIMVVDDDPAITSMMAQMLGGLGYDVTTFGGSEEALDAFEADPEAFDLVLTDQIMPEMTGIELAQEALAIRPDIPVILMTGFSAGVTREQARSMGIADLMGKPAGVQKLSASVRAALGRTADHGA